MKTIEASGRTIEEAIQMAAHELGVSVDAVEYEMVEEGTKGFLGLGGHAYSYPGMGSGGCTACPGATC